MSKLSMHGQTQEVIYLSVHGCADDDMRLACSVEWIIRKLIRLDVFTTKQEELLEEHSIVSRQPEQLQ